MRKKIWIYVLIFLVLIYYVFDLSYLVKVVKIGYSKGHMTAFLSDYKYFDNNIIENGIPQPWPLSDSYNQYSESKKLKDVNKKRRTTAFLVIKNDSLVFEKYYENYHKDSISNSFSVSKSIVSAMLGKAIMEGAIKGLDEPVSNYYEEFGNGFASKLTVGDLSSMSSGLDWVEEYYTPFSITARSYFTDNQDELILGLNIIENPGQEFKYLSGNTQLLGMIIEKATGKELSEYLSEKFWIPMGAENNAKWQIDSKETHREKSYCCIASTARDFAKFGKLYKDYGKWNGKQLLDSSFVTKSLSPKFTKSPFYGYGWWLTNYENKKVFYMRGHLGQIITVVPDDNLIIVRLGHLMSDGEQELKQYITEAYKLIK